MARPFDRRTLLRASGVLGLTAAAGSVAPRAAARQGPPPMTVLRNRPGTAPGRMYYTYGVVSGSRHSGGPGGLVIADAGGAPSWSQPGSSEHMNFQRQPYRGGQVLTWWQGVPTEAGGGTFAGSGSLTRVDHSAVDTVEAPLRPDGHELLLTPEGTALVTAYATEPRDLSAVGGPKDGTLNNSYFQEIDVATGRVLRRWDASRFVDLSESHKRLPDAPSQPWDFFHINSISITPDGHLLISARHTWALYKVHRHTGAVLWRLGGKRSSFTVHGDPVFAWQHHAVFEDARTIRVFDNGTNEDGTTRPTGVTWVHIDEAAGTAAAVETMRHPEAKSVSMGSAQRLANGNVFVCWGSANRLSEFAPSGELLFDATLDTGSYRAFKY